MFCNLTHTYRAPITWLSQALAWADANFDFVCLLKGNDIKYPFGVFETVLAIGNIGNCGWAKGCDDTFKFVEENQMLKYPEPLFGFISYDLKNQWKDISFHNTLTKDRIGLPEIFFFQPQYLIYFDTQLSEIQGEDAQKLFEEIAQIQLPPFHLPKVSFQVGMTQTEYLQKVKTLLAHIEEGDIYEINFCFEQFAQNVELNPVSVFEHLQSLSPNPFSAFFKYRDTYAFCASPERFIKKQQNQLISQPIKGTSRRSNNLLEDEQLRLRLRNSEKERAENMMITDLVRNDLACISEVGSVKVHEMFGVYTFPLVHQLITTVTGRIKPNLSWREILEATFPMGSMTGAPKIKAMELIEKYENAKRGLFSGSIGYIMPNGHFDFNVVIRTLFYNKTTQTLSMQAGSAITYDAAPEQEYQECLLKMRSVLAIFD